MGDITLLFDTEAVGSINSRKVMVAVPLLYLFMVRLLICRLTIFSRCYAWSRTPRRPAKGSTTWDAGCSSSELLVCSVSTFCKVPFWGLWWLGPCWCLWSWHTVLPFWRKRVKDITTYVCWCTMSVWLSGSAVSCLSSSSTPADFYSLYLEYSFIRDYNHRSS